MENRVTETDERTYLRVGDRVVLELPYSEVCMHMRLAGKRVLVELRDGGCQCGHAAMRHVRGADGEPTGACSTCVLYYDGACEGYRPYYVVQLYRESGTFLSLPISTGEAGIFRGDDGRLYAYGAERVDGCVWGLVP